MSGQVWPSRLCQSGLANRRGGTRPSVEGVLDRNNTNTNRKPPDGILRELVATEKHAARQERVRTLPQMDDPSSTTRWTARLHHNL